MTVKRLVICKGLPGCGKSTFAKEFVKGKKDWVRVNNDTLQEMMFGVPFAEGRGDFLDQVRRELVTYFMSKKMNIIVDNTNLHPKQEEYYRDLVDSNNELVKNGAEGSIYEFQVKDFTDVPVGVCINRNRQRPNPIPDKVIYDMYNTYIKKECKALVTQDEKLPKAIIVDIDGTMSILHDRNPYDYHKCYNDLVNKPIVDIVKMYLKQGHKIIFITGREITAKAETVRWLQDKCGISVGEYDLYMREDDKVKDTIFKKGVYEKNVQGKYFVDCWFEDRWRMADLVRHELGLTCLQCEDGFF